MSLTDEDKQWIADAVQRVVKTEAERVETALLTHMDQHFTDLEKSITRHDKGILAANIGVNGITEAQAKQEAQIRDILHRLDILERARKNGEEG